MFLCVSEYNIDERMSQHDIYNIRLIGQTLGAEVEEQSPGNSRRRIVVPLSLHRKRGFSFENTGVYLDCQPIFIRVAPQQQVLDLQIDRINGEIAFHVFEAIVGCQALAHGLG
jgi:hypothetical protein